MHTQETREKISKALISAHIRGAYAYVYTPARSAKISHTMKGRPAHNKGCLASSETRKKLAMAHMKRPFAREMERRRKIGAWFKGREPWCKGKRLSEETRSKMRVTRSTPQYREERRAIRSTYVIPVYDTSIERAMQEALVDRRIPYTKHKYLIDHQVDVFIEPNIIVECDGDYWHNRPETKAKDEARNATYEKAGYIVLHYWEHEIRANVEGCVDEIEAVIWNSQQKA